MTCNLRTVNPSLRTVKTFTDRTNCTDRKAIAPLSNFTSKSDNSLSVANNMQFTERKTLPYGPYELYRPKAKFTDRYSAGILDNPQYRLLTRLLYKCLVSVFILCDRFQALNLNAIW